MAEIGTDWRVVDEVATAWFDAPSLIEGAALAGRVVELSAEIVVDLRATGMRVRLDSAEHAEAVSAAARDLRQRALDLRRNQHRTRTPRLNARDDAPPYTTVMVPADGSASGDA